MKIINEIKEYFKNKFNQYPKHSHTYLLDIGLPLPELRIMIFIMEKIYDHPNSRENFEKELSTKYIGTGLNMRKGNVTKALNGLKKKNLICYTQLPTLKNPGKISILPFLEKLLLSHKESRDVHGTPGCTDYTEVLEVHRGVHGTPGCTRGLKGGVHGTPNKRNIYKNKHVLCQHGNIMAPPENSSPPVCSVFENKKMKHRKEKIKKRDLVLPPRCFSGKYLNPTIFTSFLVLPASFPALCVFRFSQKRREKKLSGENQVSKNLPGGKSAGPEEKTSEKSYLARKEEKKEEIKLDHLFPSPEIKINGISPEVIKTGIEILKGRKITKIGYSLEEIKAEMESRKVKDAEKYFLHLCQNKENFSKPVTGTEETREEIKKRIDEKIEREEKEDKEFKSQQRNFITIWEEYCKAYPAETALTRAEVLDTKEGRFNANFKFAISSIYVREFEKYLEGEDSPPAPAPTRQEEEEAEKISAFKEPAKLSKEEYRRQQKEALAALKKPAEFNTEVPEEEKIIFLEEVNREVNL